MGARKLVEEKITELMQALPDDELEGLLVHMENIRAKKSGTPEKHKRDRGEVSRLPHSIR